MQLIRLGFSIGALTLASLIALLFVPSDYTVSWYEPAIGYFYSIFLTHPTLAAVWLGLGLGPLRSRLAGSAAWLSLTAFFCVLCIMRVDGSESEVIVPIASMIVVQWLALQPLLWILSKGASLYIRPTTTRDFGNRENQPQMGIRHLLGLMSIIALMTVLGGAILSRVDQDTVVFLAFMGMVNVASVVPLELALLSHRRVCARALLAIAFIGLITVIELPVLDALGLEAGDFSYAFFIATNASSAALVAVTAIIVRSHGFLLIGYVRQRTEVPSQEDGMRSATVE